MYTHGFNEIVKTRPLSEERPSENPDGLRRFPLFAIMAIFVTILAGCSSGTSGTGTTPTPTPPPSPSAALSLSSATVQSGASITATATVSNATGTLTCGFTAISGSNSSFGTFSAATLSGTTCTAIYTAPSVSATTGGIITFTGGGASDSKPVTVNPVPVPQTISLAESMSVILNGTLPLDTSNVTASSSCPASAVTVTVTQTSTDTAKSSGAVFASWSSTAGSFGGILGGNSIPEDKSNTFNVVAKCGSVVSNTSKLTVTIPAPTVTAVVKTAITNGYVFTATGSGYSAVSATQNLSQWAGTLAGSVYGACPTTRPTINQLAGFGWIDANHGAQQEVGGTPTPGSWSFYVNTDAPASGVGGGWACLANAYTMAVSTVAANASSVVFIDYQTGQTTLTTNNVRVATFSLGKGAAYPVFSGDAVYAVNPAEHNIARIDLSSHSLSFISTGGYMPLALTKTSNGTVYASAALTTDFSHGALLRIGKDSVSTVAQADNITSLTSSGSRLVWIASSKDGKTTPLHVFDTASASESVQTSVQRNADKVEMLSGTPMVYMTGEKDASVLDPGSFQESGVVSFTSGIIQFNGDLVALFGGNIDRAALTADGTGKPTLSQMPFANQMSDDLYTGFAVSTVNDQIVVYSLSRSANGTASPRAHTLPLHGGR